MKKKKILFDLLYSLALIVILLIAYLIGNAIVTGFLLLIFSAVLGVNTAIKLKNNMESKFRAKFFYGLLLFLDIVLAISSLFVIVTAIIEA